MSFDIVTGAFASAVASAGSFNVGYPENRDDGDYAGGYDHVLVAIGSTFRASAGDISLAFGASAITVTYNGATTLPAGEAFSLQVDRAGGDGETNPLANTGKMARGEIVKINLGAPLAADANGVCASQGGTAATAMNINGALASGGVATFDVPRNVVAAWTGTAVLTVTGTDDYGNAIVESSASGTSRRPSRRLPLSYPRRTLPAPRSAAAMFWACRSFWPRRATFWPSWRMGPRRRPELRFRA